MMKKTIRSTLFVIPLIVIMLFTFSLNTFAVPNNQIVWNYGNKSVVFEDNSAFSNAEREYIADMLVYGESDVTLVQPRAWCWLTGHDKSTEYVAIITHKKYALEPRCLEEIFEVTTCSKCDLYDMVLVSSTAIICCEEE